MNYYNEIKNKLIDNEIYEKVSTMPTQLSWSHYTELLVLNDLNKINYYIKVTKEQKE